MNRNKSLKLEDGNKTNNRAEFRAAIVAIQLGIKHKAGSLTINTDSDLLIKTITIYKNDWKRRGWKKSSKGPIANLDEVKILDSLCSKIKVKWVSLIIILNKLVNFSLLFITFRIMFQVTVVFLEMMKQID